MRLAMKNHCVAALALALALTALASGCSDPVGRVRAVCVEAGNARTACNCLAGRLDRQLTPAQAQALVSTQALDRAGVPDALGRAGAVAFAEAVAACGASFDGAAISAGRSTPSR